MNNQDQTFNNQFIQKLHTNHNIELEKLDIFNCESNKTNQSIITLVLNSNILPKEVIKKITKEMYGLDVLDFISIEINKIPYSLTNKELLNKYNAIPILQENGSLYIAINDPNDFLSLSTYQLNTGITTQAVLMTEQDIKKIKDIIKEKIVNADLNTTNFDNQIVLNLNVDDIPCKNSVIQYVDRIIAEAIHRNASDIHFEPYKNIFRIRFRQDGQLIEVANLSINNVPMINARLKILADLDISERRIPQDGRFTLTIDNNNYDFRTSTCPTLFGEKIVIRILDPYKSQLGIENLGYEEEQQKLYLKAVEKLHGIILVTGPTGSGKTISLYTALSLLNTNGRNISTAEDPIEIYLPGINQVQINNKIGITFASALRCFLRQDPDVMMIGEIRDLDTAEIAIKAAQTGHLVLSTLHTNSAAETLNRLSNMGIPSYNIATTINMIIAQRLIRKLCNKCKKIESLPKNTLIEENFPAELISDTTIIYTNNAEGCDHCTQGYIGRIGIFETMPISKEMQEIILNNGSALDIKKQAHKENILSLRQAGIRKILKGITSLSEVNRITKDI
jgi:type IV pilus assembly protein PilB